jgi:tyrosine-protein phosphatase SIW14
MKEGAVVRLTKGSARVYVSTLVFVCSAVVAASAATTSALANIRIDNFGQVNDRYYRGAQPEGRDYGDLAALGVKLVIDLTADGDVSEARMVQDAGMKFVRIPLTTHDQPSADAVTKFLELVNDPANQPVYVHCQGGHHRTGIMTAVYRMTRDGWTADRAYDEMQKYGFGPAFLHATLKDFVYEYYGGLAHANAAVATKASS